MVPKTMRNIPPFRGAHGTRGILDRANRGAIPEVAGGSALLSDADDAGTLANHLTLVLSNNEQAERLRQLGAERVAQFSWLKTAKLVLDAYVDVLGYPARG